MRRHSLCSLQHQEPWMKSSTLSVRSARMMWVFPTPKEIREPATKPQMFRIHVTNGIRSIYRRCFFVTARTAAGLWCHLHGHHYWDTVRNRCECLVAQWHLGEEANNVLLFLLSFQGYWGDGETLSQHESCTITQLTAGSQTGSTSSDTVLLVLPFPIDCKTLKFSLYFCPYLDKTSKCFRFWSGTTDSGRCL